MMAWLALGIEAGVAAVVFVGRALIQRARTGDSGIRTGGLRARVGTAEWWGNWLFVLALVAAVAAPVAELLGLAPLVTSPTLRWFGAVIAVVGAVLTFLAQLNMGGSWRVGVDNDETTELVTTGAFSMVRNPIFTALMIFAGGLVLLIPNMVAIVGFGLFGSAIEVQVRGVEEPYLLTAHPVSFPHYAATAGRFLPGIGRVREHASPDGPG